MSRTITVHIPMRFATRGGRKMIISETECLNAKPRAENALRHALAKAHRWRKLIESGSYASITELAQSLEVNQSYACRLLRLTLLAPNLVSALLNGSQEWRPTLSELMKPRPVRWDKQMTALTSGPAKKPKGEHL